MKGLRKILRVSWTATKTRVRTDLGTDSEPHLVHCRLNRYQSIFLDRHWYKGPTVPVIKCLQHVSFDIGSLLLTWMVAVHAEFDQYLNEYSTARNTSGYLSSSSGE